MLKIPETVMSRALNPGSGAGEPDPTRVFGNRQEQFSQLPTAPTGLGGVANPMAGIEGETLARSAQQLGAVIEDKRQYYDNLQQAEEDSKAKVTLLEIEKADAELRERLAADPEHSKKTTTERQQEYELARDSMVDERVQAGGFTHKKVVKDIQDRTTNFKYTSSEIYKERVIKPQVVYEAKVRDQESDNIVIDTVSVSPTPENIAKAQENILSRYNSPVAFATYGAAGAAQLRAAAQAKLQQTTLQAYAETLGESNLAKLNGVEGTIDAADKENGVVEMLVQDEVGRLTVMVQQLNIPESEKAVLLQKGEKGIRQFANNSVKDHNTRVIEFEKQRTERVKDTIETWFVATDAMARSEGMTHKKLQQSYEKLLAHPDIVDDSDARAKLYASMRKVEASMKTVQREREQIREIRAMKESITSMRMDNGIAVSGSALDTAWQKNGTLKSFFEGGKVVSPLFLQEIDRAGAVPTSVLGSIKSDLQSDKAEERQRGVSNLVALKGYSPKTQTALLKDLPDGWGGVIQRMEAGQTYDQAVSFLSQPRPTPDIEKKLKTLSNDKKNMPVAEDVLKQHGWPVDKMSIATKENLLSQWEDAFVQSGGDAELAKSLFKQSLAKNKSVGVSGHSGKVELFPATNYAPKEIVNNVIHKSFPELKGKEVRPVYAGKRVIVENGKTKEVPYYDIWFMGDKGFLERATDALQLTEESVAAEQQAITKAKEEKAAKEFEEQQKKWDEEVKTRKRIAADNKDRTQAVSALDEIRIKKQQGTK